MYLVDLFTIPANLAGIPAVSVPIGAAGSLPVGLQVQAAAGADGMALRVAAAGERAMGPGAPPAMAMTGGTA
jgi:aspartyl-tRNA(Asn)/glutamyl-tRNA(Gln) amidotransferase subunit A